MKKISKKLIVIFFCLIALTLLVIYSIARYESFSSTKANLEVAFYLLNEDYQSMNLNLSSISPRTEAYVYNFAISNTDGTRRTETSLQYDMQVVTTTNLPLEYELYMNEQYTDASATSCVKTDTTKSDEYGTYFRTLTTETQNFGYQTDQTNYYQLVVYFKEEYKDISYQDIIESIEIQVNSKQIIE